MARSVLNSLAFGLYLVGFIVLTIGFLIGIALEPLWRRLRGLRPEADPAPAPRAYTPAE